MSRRPASVIDIGTARRRRLHPHRPRPATRVGRRPLWPAAVRTPAGDALVHVVVDQDHAADAVLIDIQAAPGRRRTRWPIRINPRPVVAYLPHRSPTMTTSHHEYRTTGADLAAVLRVFANADQLLDLQTAFTGINPSRGIPRDGRRREHKAWVNRQLCLFAVTADAHRWGFLAETAPAGDGQPFRSSITPQGIAWLHPDLSLS